MHKNEIEIDYNKLKKLYESDMAIDDIAEELYISRRTVYRLLKKYNFPKRKNIRKIVLNKKQLKEMIIENNNNYSQIAKLLGVSKQTVIRRCKEYNIFMKKLSYEEKEKKIYKLYFIHNMSMRNISTLLNISTKTICEIFKNNEWKARDKKDYFKQLNEESYRRNNK